MPVYEYECVKCGRKFELRRSITDSENEIKCPECGDEHPRKVFSIFGIGSASGACSPDRFT